MKAFVSFEGSVAEAIVAVRATDKIYEQKYDRANYIESIKKYFKRHGFDIHKKHCYADHRIKHCDNIEEFLKNARRSAIILAQLEETDYLRSVIRCALYKQHICTKQTLV